MKEKDKNAYLERIGFPVTGPVSREVLAGLVRAHLEHIPFENLDVIGENKIPKLDEETLLEKIVRRKRGGYCFELNTLFLRLLEALGTEVYPVAVRVLWGKTELPPASHMGLVAIVEGKKYFCDVGYGGPGPKGLLCLEEGEQEIAGSRFRVSKPKEGHFLMEGLHGGEWKKILYFSDVPFEEVDFQLLNFYCARNEKVIFTRKRIVNICTPAGSKALTDNELTIHEAGQVQRRTCRDDEEVREVLRKEFGILGI